MPQIGVTYKLLTRIHIETSAELSEPSVCEPDRVISVRYCGARRCYLRVVPVMDGYADSSMMDAMLQISEAFSAGMSADVPARRVQGVCVLGVCPSVVGAEMVCDDADEFSLTPVPVIRDTRVPGWVSDGTLAILIIGSGCHVDFEDTIVVMQSRGCDIVCVCADGGTRLPEGVARVTIPKGMGIPEESAFVAGVVARAVQDAGFTQSADRLAEAVRESRDMTGAHMERAASVVPAISGRVPAVYSTSDIHACSRWWRHVLGRWSLSFCGELPEFDHNELVGWSDPNVHAPELSMVVLRGERGPGLVRDIVGCMEQVLDENGRRVVTVDLGEGSAMQRNVRGFMIGSAVGMIMEAGE